MIGLAPGRRETLELVERVSVAGQGGVTAPILLERICRAVAEAFAFRFVAASSYDAETDEVSEVALAGVRNAAGAKRQPIAGFPVLAEARATRSLVVVSAGTVSSAFALPLISGGRCLGFLSGNCVDGAVPGETERQTLATIGVIAAALLESALGGEEMQELEARKSEFIALAAHELRTPLANIYGISITLSERGHALAESDRSRLCETLRDQTTRMRHLGEQLLDLSRFDLDAIHVSPERVRLRAKIEELIRPLGVAGTRTPTVNVPADLEVSVDPNALDRMLSNLVTNALRHGKPPVTITATAQDTHLRLVVEDRGEGISAEFVPDLFDRFTRSAATRGRTDGSGLGLAIALAYARAHGGDILYEAAAPHGARFELVIPLRGRRAKPSLNGGSDRLPGSSLPQGAPRD